MVRAQLVVINQMLPRNFKNTPFIADDEDGESASFVIYIRLPPNLAKGWPPDDGEPVGAEQVYTYRRSYRCRCAGGSSSPMSAS